MSHSHDADFLPSAQPIPSSSNAAPVGSPAPDSSSQTLHFAHPNWVVSEQVDQVSRRFLGAAATPERLARLRGQVRTAWRTPSSQADLEANLDREAAHPDFVWQFEANGGAGPVAQTLQLLHRLAHPALDFNQAAALATALAAQMASIAAAPAAASHRPARPWGVTERADRLALAQADPRFAQTAARRLAQQNAHDESLARQANEQSQAKARERDERLQAASAGLAAQKAAAAARLEAWFEAHGVTENRFPLPAYEALQSGAASQDFRTVHDVGPSPSALRRMFGLDGDTLAALQAHHAGLEEQRRQRNEARRQWEKSLLNGEEAAHAMFVTRAEFDEWVALQRIAVATTKPLAKWSRDTAQMLFDPAALALLSTEQIDAWRESDLEGMSAADRGARIRSVDKARTRQGLARAMDEVLKTHDCHLLHHDTNEMVWTKQVALPIAVETLEGPATWQARVRLEARVAPPKSPNELGSLSARVGVSFSAQAQARIAQQLADGVSDLLDEYAGALTPQQRMQVQEGVKTALERGIRQSDLAQGVESVLVESVGQLLKRIEAERAQELVKLKDYPQAFPVARDLQRSIHFKLGPTNSGKTYEALIALQNARSGVYLAPLRLLAMEIRDRLTAQGIPCNLMTGEEHDIVPGARHTACTMEMMNPQNEVDVAVIDEIQMLRDPGRGWAWTAALVGVPARDVYVCGSPSVHASCIQVLDAIGEAHQTAWLQRKTPLEVEVENVTGGQRGKKGMGRGLQPGDAVIAFSRKDVLTLSARYREQGFSVATIYGALAPEVRRTESERFATGEAHIVVATDAIGMGLNLRVHRVVFSTVHKFDGVQTRPLNTTEVRQIAGRAGRYGMHPKGLVSALDREDLPHIRRMLLEEEPSAMFALAIAPSPWHIEALAQLLGTQHIGAILAYFATRIAAHSSLFETAGLEEQTTLAHLVDRLAPGMSLQEKFTWSCAPISSDKDNERDYFEICLRAFLAKRPLALPQAGAWLDQGHPGYLEPAEHMSKDISLYAWLSFKFPQVFVQAQDVAGLRTQVGRYIERELLRQDGFGQTSKEAFDSRRR
ncbi:helicase-related protein [Caenimonas terrae]|uniref:Helicase-related protein n=1 Tax=Caenimonas terrae TaxID=696074 RepID=A0ABW0NGI3_9BURK